MSPAEIKPRGAMGVATLGVTGNPARLIVGGGAKAYGEYSVSSKVEGRAKETAKLIAEKVKPKFQEQAGSSKQVTTADRVS